MTIETDVAIVLICLSNGTVLVDDWGHLPGNCARRSRSGRLIRSKYDKQILY